MKVNSQTPIPPQVSTINNETGTIKTVAKSKAENAYAFSCTFKENLTEKISEIIESELEGFSIKYIGKKYKKEEDGKYTYKIELKSSELKLEYKIFDGISESKQESLINSFFEIEKKILALD